jgi:hypothetical protein
MGAEKQVEFADGLNGIGEKWFDGTGLVAAQRAGVVWRKTLGAGKSAGTIVNKNCDALYQETAPISAKPNMALAVSKNFGAPCWQGVDSPRPVAGALQVLG